MFWKYILSKTVSELFPPSADAAAASAEAKVNCALKLKGERSKESIQMSPHYKAKPGFEPTCKICLKPFGRKDHLQRHIRRTHHSGTGRLRLEDLQKYVQSKEIPKNAICSTCGAVVSTFRLRRFHVCFPPSEISNWMETPESTESPEVNKAPFDASFQVKKHRSLLKIFQRGM